MGEIISKHIENSRRPSLIISEYNYSGYLLDALSPQDPNIRIYHLKNTGKIIVRKNGDHVRTNITYDKGYCRIEANFFGKIIIFEGDDIDDTWDRYNKWCNTRSAKYTLYRAPDGTEGSYIFFKREALQGHFHGCKIGILDKSKI